MGAGFLFGVLKSVRLHPAGLQGLRLPSFKTEQRAWSQQQRHQWFNGWGDLTRLKQGPGATPHCVWLRADRTWWQSSPPKERGELPFIGELTAGGLISYQGNQQRGTPLTTPSIRIITSWGLGQVRRKVSQVCKIQVNQALVGQGMNRGQENSHLE